MLSCSHTFHAHCIESFEKFVAAQQRSNGRRTVSFRCPLCRRQDYERVRIRDGEEAFRNRCATKIQATWRGYIVRKAYVAAVLLNPGVHSRPAVVAKLSVFTDKLIRHSEGARDHLEAELMAMDAQAREASSFLKSAPVERIEADDWTRLEDSAFQSGPAPQCAICLHVVVKKTTNSTPGPSGTKNDLKKGGGRGSRTVVRQRAKPEAKESQRRCTVLSCGHVFHSTCVDSFEKFAAEFQRVCPLCRSAYVRKDL